MKDPFDESGNFVLDDREVDMLLERFDETPQPLQRQIVSAFVAQLFVAKKDLAELKEHTGMLREALAGVVRRCSATGYVGQDGQYLKEIRAVMEITRG